MQQLYSVFLLTTWFAFYCISDPTSHVSLKLAFGPWEQELPPSPSPSPSLQNRLTKATIYPHICIPSYVPCKISERSHGFFFLFRIKEDRASQHTVVMESTSAKCTMWRSRDNSNVVCAVLLQEKLSGLD